jgi:site-specific DNA-methyltransferase (adenine-specific)/adenine-specific DNA-methyltransferase
LPAGQRAVSVGGVRFLISFIEPRARRERPRPLKAKRFALFNAGVYDRDRLRALDWARYKPFVMQLFGVREDPHPIRVFQSDGFIGTDSVHVWNYPDQKTLALDEGYVESLHELMRGEAGDKFYVIAPVTALTFMSDELRFGQTRYIILKVPESVLNRLLESGAGGALQQPLREEDVNEVIDAVGFDFVSQPQTEQQFLVLAPESEDLLNAGHRDAVVRVTEFRARTMTTAPEDYPNFSTLSMVMIDPDFDGDVFSLGSVQWGEALVASELKRLDVSVSGDHEAKAAACERLDIRIPADSLGERTMVILVDRYGNEKRLEIAREEFAGSEPSRRRVTKRAAKKTAVKKSAAKKTAAKQTGRRRRGR